MRGREGKRRVDVRRIVMSAVSLCGGGGSGDVPALGLSGFLSGCTTSALRRYAVAISLGVLSMVMPSKA